MNRKYLLKGDNLWGLLPACCGVSQLENILGPTNIHIFMCGMTLVDGGWWMLLLLVCPLHDISMKMIYASRKRTWVALPNDTSSESNEQALTYVN